MKRRRHKRTPLNILIPTPNENQCFVLGKCAGYLHRYWAHYSSLEVETLEFTCWVLGHEKEKLGRFVLEHLMERVVDDEELSEALSDADDYARTIFVALSATKSVNLTKFRRHVLDLLKQAAQEVRPRGKTDIEKSVASMAKMFRLTDLEKDLLIFLFITSTCQQAESFFVDHLRCHSLISRRTLATMLNISPGALNKALNGTLGKIELYESDANHFRISDDFLRLLENPSEQSFLRDFYRKVDRTPIPLEFHNLEEDQIKLTLKLLKEKQKTSTHLLFYGPPGTGKTSFAHRIHQELGIPNYEIVNSEKNTTSCRRAAILACLNMTNAGDGALVIVDEADNILNTRHSWFFRGETQDKGWLNKILEEPGTRMIWITNSIDDIEESVLRRFAFSLRFKPFNQRQRIQLWERILRRRGMKRFFREPDIVALARKYKVSAGAIDLAVKKASEPDMKTTQGVCRSIELALNAHLALLNSGETRVDKDSIEKHYSLEGLNAEGDMDAMMGQLEEFDRYLRDSKQKRSLNMNLLFYGPPGTGKSELSRHIAKHLDREVICKRASDLLDPYVGMTERGIRDAFQEAEREEAVLVIDEVDTMLFSRDRAQRSWEVSFTNEFLTQMERYRGILICTTNRLEDLDEASIRRFNHKIGFQYLTPEGNVIFYTKLLSPLVRNPMDTKSERCLREIADLAPGDFRVVRDRFSFQPSGELTHQRLVRALEEEASIKTIQKGTKVMGFM